jgi:hypothetical protein
MVCHGGGAWKEGLAHRRGSGPTSGRKSRPLICCRIICFDDRNLPGCGPQWFKRRALRDFGG